MILGKARSGDNDPVMPFFVPACVMEADEVIQRICFASSCILIASLKYIVHSTTKKSLYSFGDAFNFIEVNKFVFQRAIFIGT